MMYIRLCTYTETSNPHKYHFTGNCVICSKPKTVSVLGEELYKFNKGLISQISNPDDEREFLISGICPECWNETFKDDEVDPFDVESRLTEIKDDLSVEWPENK